MKGSFKKEKIIFHEKNLKDRKIILLINFIFVRNFFLIFSSQIFKNYAILINHRPVFQGKDYIQLDRFWFLKINSFMAETIEKQFPKKNIFINKLLIFIIKKIVFNVKKSISLDLRKFYWINRTFFNSKKFFLMPYTPRKQFLSNKDTFLSYTVKEKISSNWRKFCWFKKIFLNVKKIYFFGSKKILLN